MKKLRRAERRSHYDRLLKRYAEANKTYGFPESTCVEIGRRMVTSAKRCSCHRCGNPRRLSKEKTRQEMLSCVSWDEQLRESGV